MGSIGINSLQMNTDSLLILGISIHRSILYLDLHSALRLFVERNLLALILKAYILHLLACSLLIASLCEFCHFLIEIPEGIMLVALIQSIRSWLRTGYIGALWSLALVCTIRTYHI